MLRKSSSQDQDIVRYGSAANASSLSVVDYTVLATTGLVAIEEASFPDIGFRVIGSESDRMGCR